MVFSDTKQMSFEQGATSLAQLWKSARAEDSNFCKGRGAIHFWRKQAEQDAHLDKTDAVVEAVIPHRRLERGQALGAQLKSQGVYAHCCCR